MLLYQLRYLIYKVLIFVKNKEMPEVTITYKKPKTLEVLKCLAKYLDYTISEPRPIQKKKNIIKASSPIAKDKKGKAQQRKK